MRLRCWYEVVIGTATGRRIVLREEGLRGDDARTTGRAIGRWRKMQDKGAGVARTARLPVRGYGPGLPLRNPELTDCDRLGPNWEPSTLKQLGCNWHDLFDFQKLCRPDLSDRRGRPLAWEAGCSR